MITDTLDKMFPSSAIPDYNSAVGNKKLEKFEDIRQKKTITYALFASLIIQPVGWLSLSQYGSNFMSWSLIIWGSVAYVLLFLIQENKNQEMKKEISALKEIVKDLRSDNDVIKKRLGLI